MSAANCMDGLPVKKSPRVNKIPNVMVTQNRRCVAPAMAHNFVEYTRVIRIWRFVNSIRSAKSVST